MLPSSLWCHEEAGCLIRVLAANILIMLAVHQQWVLLSPEASWDPYHGYSMNWKECHSGIGQKGRSPVCTPKKKSISLKKKGGVRSNIFKKSITWFKCLNGPGSGRSMGRLPGPFLLLVAVLLHLKTFIFGDQPMSFSLYKYQGNYELQLPLWKEGIMMVATKVSFDE